MRPAHATDSPKSRFASVQHNDPLVLDLDGDGLETVGVDQDDPILFDHDGDGLATGTGWLQPDDGFLALDRNGNGVIDNGTELFGDSMPLFNATGEIIGEAVGGFAALAAQDTNGNGVVNAADANWERLRVWQDTDSDAQTDPGELHKLNEFDIIGLRLAREDHRQSLSNDNVIGDLGVYVKAGVQDQTSGIMAAVHLTSTPFYSDFKHAVTLSEAAESLPAMHGSGYVRDLRQAASLSPELVAILSRYAAGDTRAEQLALIDELIAAWAATSTRPNGVAQARAQGYRLEYLVPGMTPELLALRHGHDTSVDTKRLAELLAKKQRVTKRIGILEQFNGITFVDIGPHGVTTGSGKFIPAREVPGSAVPVVYVTLVEPQISLLESAYAALRKSVYQGLLRQTRPDAAPLRWVEQAGVMLQFMTQMLCMTVCL